MYINEQLKININGSDQFVSIRSEKKNAPLMLYLHGGPGDAALPLVLKYNRELEKHFTVVVWEQRGAGKSYYPFRQNEVVNVELFLEDLYQLIKMLLKRFEQEKLYLIGHSWGSVLGLRFVTRHPEMIIIYLGCGQVVNMKKSCQLAYEFAVAKSSGKMAEKLRKIDCSYTQKNWLKDLLFVTNQVVRHKGSLYGKANYNQLILPFICSKYYSVSDLIKRQKGGMQSLRWLWQELMQTDFEGQTKFDVPVMFIEGRHDIHVSSVLAKSYFDTIETEKQFVWFEESCHFPQWSENERFNRLVIDLLSRE